MLGSASLSDNRDEWLRPLGWDTFFEMSDQRVVCVGRFSDVSGWRKERCSTFSAQVWWIAWHPRSSVERLQRAQHKRRLSWMPWLYRVLKPKHRTWAEPWQARIQARLCALETVEIGPDCFVAPEARIFAEPGRVVRLGPRCSIAAGVFIHGPVELDSDVSINAGAHLDGGRKGIRIGAGTRIAAGVRIFAFDHGLDAGMPIREQPVVSHGIQIGADVWIGAGAGITDGVSIADGAVVAMGAVVTRDVSPGMIVAGIPAQPIGRRERK